jgi:hypothetical protein
LEAGGRRGGSPTFISSFVVPMMSLTKLGRHQVGDGDWLASDGHLARRKPFHGGGPLAWSRLMVVRGKDVRLPAAVVVGGGGHPQWMPDCLTWTCMNLRQGARRMVGQLALCVWRLQPLGLTGTRGRHEKKEKSHRPCWTPGWHHSLPVASSKHQRCVLGQTTDCRPPREPPAAKGGPLGHEPWPAILGPPIPARYPRFGD